MTPADRWTHADDSPASRDREEGREAVAADWRSEWVARPASDPTEPPWELRGVYGDD